MELERFNISILTLILEIKNYLFFQIFFIFFNELKLDFFIKIFLKKLLIKNHSFFQSSGYFSKYSFDENSSKQPVFLYFFFNFRAFNHNLFSIKHGLFDLFHYD